MYPVRGLSPKPVVGALEVPLETNDLKNTFYGAATMGSASNPKIWDGIRNNLWSSGYDNGDVTINDGSKTTILFTRTGITELSVCFDVYMLPVVAYVLNDEAYLRFYDTAAKAFVTRNLTELSKDVVKTPCVTLDDRFRTPLIIHEFTDNKNYLNQISMGDNNRLHFVPYRNEE